MTPPDFSSDAEKYEAVNQPSTHTFSGALYMPGSLRQAYLAGASRGYEVGKAERIPMNSLILIESLKQQLAELQKENCCQDVWEERAQLRTRLEDAERKAARCKRWLDFLISVVKASKVERDQLRTSVKNAEEVCNKAQPLIEPQTFSEFELTVGQIREAARAYFAKHSADGGGDGT
jgi:regulator of replication initiation timing